MAIFKEKVIKVTDYKVLGELPDPFLRADGTRVASAKEFDEHKKELYKNVVELQYGTMPPAPEFVEVEPLNNSRKDWGRLLCYRINTGTRAHPVSFTMRVYQPKSEEKTPVIVDGDLCWDYAFDESFRRVALDAGIGLVLFNRTELAPDIKSAGRHSPLYDCYPDYTFGALGAWAWGFSRCVDALEQLDLFDLDWIAFTGHSRGAKTAMLAGILDKRARIVAPNETNAGSCSCYRIHMKAIKEDGKEFRSETLADIHKNFPFWFGPNLGDYAGREAELPFDAHFTKAMVAPRTLMVAEAASDIWTNPIGTWMTTQAVKEVYRLYGKEENLFWYFRHGGHSHKPEDLRMLVSVIRHQRYGEPLDDGFFSTPFEEPELIYRWECPEKE